MMASIVVKLWTFDDSNYGFGFNGFDHLNSSWNCSSFEEFYFSTLYHVSNKFFIENHKWFH